MSQTFFSKQDPSEKISRLSLLGSSKGVVTVWVKGQKTKYKYPVIKFDKDKMEILLDTEEKPFSLGSTVLCTFELSGMNFFSEVIFQESVSDYSVLQFNNTLFKSERRNSYRLMTFPQFEIFAEFNLGEAYVGGKVVNLKTKTSQTNLFKNFLKIVGDNTKDGVGDILSLRVFDLSTSGMAIQVTELEIPYFNKDCVFNNVVLRFKDEILTIPEVKVVYVVEYFEKEKNMKKFKLGLHFENLPSLLDDRIGRKINILLRKSDFNSNKDFENMLK